MGNIDIGIGVGGIVALLQKRIDFEVLNLDARIDLSLTHSLEQHLTPYLGAVLLPRQALLLQTLLQLLDVQLIALCRFFDGFFKLIGADLHAVLFCNAYLR